MLIPAVNTMLAAALVAAQFGAIRGIAVDTNDSGTVSFRVTGTNPCTGLQIAYGDGESITTRISELPAMISHRYVRAGDYPVVVNGTGNCRGRATVNVRTLVSQPASSLPPQSQGRGLGRGRSRSSDATLRFPEMDRNDDGVITRDEWTGSSESFRVHDWNRDGVLSGTEVQIREARPYEETAEPARGGAVPGWSRTVFQRLDRDGNNRVTFDEWPYDIEAFRRVDVNNDRVLTESEFLSTAIDDDRDDRFEFLDLNNDGFISQAEWHGSQVTFDRLDRNRDRRLSRAEAVGEQTGNGAGLAARVTVPSNVPWTDTGLAVRAGEELVITSRGDVTLSGAAGDRADAEGSVYGRISGRAPLPRVLLGSLIGRVDRSAPFEVTTGGQRLRIPRDGRLYLGINDDSLSDNHGQFDVTVRRMQ